MKKLIFPRIFLLLLFLRIKTSGSRHSATITITTLTDSPFSSFLRYFSSPSPVECPMFRISVLGFGFGLEREATR